MGNLNICESYPQIRYELGMGKTFLSPTIHQHHILAVGAIDVSTSGATARLMISSPCLMPFKTIVDRIRVVYCWLGVFFIIALSA